MILDEIDDGVILFSKTNEFDVLMSNKKTELILGSHTMTDKIFVKLDDDESVPQSLSDAV